jgi:hypothetical protein
MLAGDETGAPFVDLAQQGTGTEVPVLPPEIVRVHGLKHQPQHGAFLGMAIFTGKDIAPQAVSGLIDDQGFPGQGAAVHLSQGFEAPVTRLNTIAINNFYAVPRHPGGTRTIQLLDQRRQHRSTLAYQRRRGVRLDPVELVLERDEGGSNLVFVVPIRRSHRGLETKDHLAEHVIDGRKQPGAGVLLLGGPGKPGIELVRSQDAFQRATYHHGNGTFLHKTCEHFAQHGGLLQRVCVEGL